MAWDVVGRAFTLRPPSTTSRTGQFKFTLCSVKITLHVACVCLVSFLHNRWIANIRNSIRILTNFARRFLSTTKYTRVIAAEFFVLFGPVRLVQFEISHKRDCMRL